MPDSPKDKFPPDFWSWLQQHPDDVVHALIRVTALTPEIEAAVRGAACRVYRRVHLIPTLAVEGSGDALMRLAAEPWVQRIEPDQSVRAI
jgi:hypothetical protein